MSLFKKKRFIVPLKILSDDKESNSSSVTQEVNQHRHIHTLTVSTHEAAETEVIQHKANPFTAILHLQDTA